MNIDIVFVTYNSKKWLKGNIESIIKSDYDLKNKVSLLYYDNASTDDTYEELEKLQKEYSKYFKDIKIERGRKNKGFGVGNNNSAKLGNSEYLLILNTDTEVNKDTLKKIEEEVKNAPDEVGIFELKQTPYEHPKFYDPYTGYVSWASGACMVFRRDVFEKIGGFDKRIFMYCEDVEISWRIRSLGYKIKYLYNVPIIHYSYTEPYQFKETAFVYGYINNLYLRAKYGSLKNTIKGHLLVVKAIMKNQAGLPNDQYKKVKKRLRRAYIKMTFKNLAARMYKHTHTFDEDFKPKFINQLDYECTKINPFLDMLNLPKLKKNPLVSIIVRTCGRPNMLRENLVSLRKQTYKNIEVVIVEDGENISEKMIKEEFSDLNIKYKATGKKAGRSKVGNLAMEMASGEYLNFLDDDDLYFPEHVERLVTYAASNNYDIVYDTLFETATNILSRDPYKYEIVNTLVVHKEKFSKLTLYKRNIFPIQVVMFKKSVFEKCGGFDESMDALEDWDLWIRFSFDYNFHFYKDTTSLYRVPANNNISVERQQFIDSYLDYIHDKYQDRVVNLTMTDIIVDTMQ